MPPLDYDSLWIRLDKKFGDLYEKLEENAKCIRQVCEERKEECAIRFFNIEGSIRDKATERKIRQEYALERRDWGKWVIRGALSALGVSVLAVIGMILTGKVQIWVSG